MKEGFEFAGTVFGLAPFSKPLLSLRKADKTKQPRRLTISCEWGREEEEQENGKEFFQDAHPPEELRQEVLPQRRLHHLFNFFETPG